MIHKLIDNINRILNKGVLILHISKHNLSIRSIERLDYKIYVKCKEQDPRLLFSVFRTKNIYTSNEEMEQEVYQEILKFIIRGGLKEYE